MNYQNKLNASIQFGLLVDCLVEDEQIHRVATTAKPKSKNGWYVSYGHLLVMGDWLTGVTEIWKPEGHQRSIADKQLIKEVTERNKRQKLFTQKQAAINAREQYRLAQQVAVHPYLSAKSIGPADGLRLSGKWLLVPLYDLTSNELVNLQRIAPNGRKLFSKGGQIIGTGFPIGVFEGLCKNDKIYVCEGYATASSIHIMTGQPVIAAMNAGNLLPVVKAIINKWPYSEIVIAGDDDWLTEQKIGFNPGKAKATEAANLVGAKVSFPPFSPGDKKAGLTDWNDYYVAASNKVVA
jgi:putative DNA primase/helicase